MSSKHSLKYVDSECYEHIRGTGVKPTKNHAEFYIIIWI